MKLEDTNVLNLVMEFQKSSNEGERLRLGCKIAGIVGPPLKAYLLKVYPEHFEDVLSETLYAIFSSLHQFNKMNIASFRSWCFRIASNKLNTLLRKELRNLELPAEVGHLWAALKAGEPTGEISPERMVDYQYVIGLLMKSKPDCFPFLYMRIGLDLDFKTIAKAHDLKTPAAMRRTERCLEYAQELVAKKL